MSTPPIFREATASDADRIAHLHAESWRRAYRGSYSDTYLDGPIHEERGQVWRHRYRSPNPAMYTLLALDPENEDEDGPLLGFACSFAAGAPNSPAEHDDPKWGTLLDNLHVTGAAEGRGIGRQLLAASALWSEREHPDDGFFLWVLTDNARARRFYEHLGAVDEGAEESEQPGGIVIGHRYVWHSIDPLRPHAPANIEA
jgi:GNAT superfamily N-acetyltransferase